MIPTLRQSGGRRRRVREPQLKVDLVSWWSLDEASGVRADSHGGYDMTAVGGVGSGGGLVGNAASFTASPMSLLSRADGPEFRATSSFTAAGWINFSPSSYGRHLIGRDNNPTREWVLYVAGGGSPRLLIYGATNNIVADAALTTTILTAGSWHLLVGWYDADNNQAGIHVGGGQTLIVSSGTPAGKSISTTIGRSEWANLNTQTVGLIDEVAFWRRVLTPGERALLYNSGDGLGYSDI